MVNVLSFGAFSPTIQEDTGPAAEGFNRREDRYVPGTMIAVIHGALGGHDAAFEWLDLACRELDYFLIFFKVDPAYDPLRGDPRFATLLERMNFSP